jgi:biotin operon repressor
MNTTKYLQRLQRIDALIRRQNTGSPKDLAEKLEISERQVYNCIEELKEMGLPISYYRNRQTYAYDENCKLNIGITIEYLSTQEKVKVFGGTSVFFIFSSNCNKIAV